MTRQTMPDGPRLVELPGDRTDTPIPPTEPSDETRATIRAIATFACWRKDAATAEWHVSPTRGQDARAWDELSGAEQTEVIDQVSRR